MKHVSGYTNSARFRALEDLQKDSADLCLSYCGWEYCDPGHRYGPNMRTTYVLHIIRSGRGTLEIHKTIIQTEYQKEQFSPKTSSFRGFLYIPINLSDTTKTHEISTVTNT